MKVLQRQLALARSFGVECEVITPARGRRALPAPAHRRPRRRDLDPGRRQGQSGRPDDVARQGRAPARREDRRGRGGDRRAHARRPRRAASRGTHAGEDGDDRAARSSSTAPASGRAQFGALAGVNVPLWSAEHFYIVTEPDRRRASDAAGDARPRRLHLLQGGGRRPGDGRLRAEGQAVERRPDPDDFPSSCSARTGTSSSR